MKKFSIVIPVYYNELNIPDTVPRLKKLQTLLPNYDLEFVFVDDGSKDRSLELLLQERAIDDRIKVVKLSKNNGSMAAMQAGLTIATGDCVGIISADLQDPPELFKEMIDAWQNGKKVVLAVREAREESLTQRLFSNTYYRLMRKFAISDYPTGGFDFVLLDRQVVEELNSIHEKNTNIMTLIYWLGHERTMIPYTRMKREKGVSRWTFSKKVKLFVDSFVAFSYVPIRAMSFLGVVFACMGFIYAGYVIFDRLYNGATVIGWAALISILAIGLGSIMVMLGIIGEYLWRVLDETRKRPAYVIDEIYR